MCVMYVIDMFVYMCVCVCLLLHKFHRACFVAYIYLGRVTAFSGVQASIKITANLEVKCLWKQGQKSQNPFTLISEIMRNLFSFILKTIILLFYENL